MTNGEARETARGLVRGSIIEDAASQFIALVLKETHDSRIKPLRAEVEALVAKLAEVTEDRDDLLAALDDPRVKALAEALRDMTALAMQLGAIDLETRDAIAALSALEENK